MAFGDLLLSTTMNNSAHSILSLPTDILSLITDYLTLDSAKDLSLANSAIHRPARYRVLRAITLNLKVTNFEPTAQWLRTLECDEWLSAVRTVKVLDHEYHYHRHGYRDVTNASAHADRIRNVCRALKAMPGLVELDWQSNNIPLEIFECLALMPGVKLTAHVYERHERSLRAMNGSPENVLLRLRSCPNLHDLDVDLRYTKADECRTFTRALRNVLLTC